MKEIIKKYYLGAWQNLYGMSWPVRFFIELSILILAGILLVKLIRYVGRKLKIDIILIKAWVWIVTEIIYLVGRDREWAITANNKMIDWGTETINGNRKKNSAILKRVICLGVVVVYFLAVFVDLTFAKRLSGYYLEELEGVKLFFRKYEIMISKDYEKYPPLFVKTVAEEPKEKAEEETVEEAVVILEDREPIYIQLNERGKRGSNIRSETNLDDNNNIIGGVNVKSEILYCDEWSHDGERYWIRVYIPADDIEGWLSGNLVDSRQLEKIISENVHLTESGKEY